MKNNYENWEDWVTFFFLIWMIKKQITEIR